MPALTYTAVAGCRHLPYVAYLKKWLPRAAKLIKKPPAEVSIALLGNAKMAALHQQFMNIPGPTDVMTFELDHDARGRVTAGEVVICVPYAQREAKRRTAPVESEILLYALHGLLHLSGYDDLEPKDYEKMHREEDRILAAIGIGALFSAPPPLEGGGGGRGRRRYSADQLAKDSRRTAKTPPPTPSLKGRGNRQSR